MAPKEKHIFEISGPKHLAGLPSIDWNNPHHQRSVAASLVQGVYTLDYDRRQNSSPLAPSWWCYFNFDLEYNLIDSHGTIFCAIYRHNYPLSAPNIPSYVIAFRGTIWKHVKTMLRDMKANIRCIFNDLHKDSSFQHAMGWVEEKVRLAGARNVWLAGHSLGSAMALLAGRQMAEMGYPLGTFLFNPPFCSFPMGVAVSITKAALSLVVDGRLHDDHFNALSNWYPYIFVNPADPICSEYIKYFERRDKMEEIGFGFEKLERLATKYSLRSQLKSLLGINFGSEVPRQHLLPSAYLIKNTGQVPDSKAGLIERFKLPIRAYKAHKLQQWWDPYLSLQCFHYKYKYPTLQLG